MVAGARIGEMLAIAALAVAPLAIPYLVLGLLETRYAAGPLKSRGAWWLNLKVAALYAATAGAIGGVAAWIVGWSRAVNRGGLLDLGAPAHGWLATAAACLTFVLAWDFFYYWWHRAQHRIPALWSIHKLHHSDDTLGVSTQSRVHWLEDIGRVPAIVLPMALLLNLGPPAGATALVFLMSGWSAFIHANLRLQLGRASAWVAGPQFHRIHHSRLIEHRDVNFAAYLPLWDVLFGSYRHPARDEFPPTGIDDEPAVETLWQGATLPFRRTREPGPIPS